MAGRARSTDRDRLGPGLGRDNACEEREETSGDGNLREEELAEEPEDDEEEVVVVEEEFEVEVEVEDE